MESDSRAALLDVFYLPPVQYMAHLAAHPELRLEQCAPYLKGTYRNRCVIATGGGPLTLSVPLLSGKYGQPLREVRIAYHESWQRQHWRSIHDAYRSAPFFDHYAEAFEPFFRQEKELLLEWNMGLLDMVMRQLGLSKPLSLTEKYEPEPENVTDLRNAFAFKPRRQREDPQYRTVPYVQVFQDRHGFIPNLSILDLLFCTGPEALHILRRSLIQHKNNDL
jgi:hypothetical protein